MKKRLYVICGILVALGFMAFTYLAHNNTTEDLKSLSRAAVVNKNELKSLLLKDDNPDLIYKVESRYAATISKEDLHNATSVLDIVPKKATGWWEVDFQSVMVSILEEDGEEWVMGEDKELNSKQKELLNSADYASSFYIKARGKDNHPETGRIEDYVYYISVVPEKKAEYSEGYDALIEYLKVNSQKETEMIKQSQLMPARITFTVTKTGTIGNVQLSSTSRYDSVDEHLMQLITNMPGTWEPATNSIGEKVDQELIFFFGLEGC